MNTGPFLSHLHRFSDGSTRLKVIYFLLNIVLSRLRCQDKTTLRGYRWTNHTPYSISPHA